MSRDAFGRPLRMQLRNAEVDPDGNLVLYDTDACPDCRADLRLDRRHPGILAVDVRHDPTCPNPDYNPQLTPQAINALITIASIRTKEPAR